MSAARVARRMRWREDHPAHFNRARKERAAEAMGGRLRPRLSFPLYELKRDHPERYAELERRANQASKPEIDVPAGVTTTKPLPTPGSDFTADVLLARERTAAIAGVTSWSERPEPGETVFVPQPDGSRVEYRRPNEELLAGVTAPDAADPGEEYDISIEATPDNLGSPEEI